MGGGGEAQARVLDSGVVQVSRFLHLVHSGAQFAIGERC